VTVGAQHQAFGRPGLTKSSLVLCATLVVLCVAAVAPADLNHDAAWYLYMVERWFGGAVMYRDVIDTNPPLILWVSAPPVWVAQVTGWSAPAVFKAYVFAVALLALTAVAAIVRRTWANQQYVLLGMTAFACLPFVKGDFGQREHFAVLITLPYIFHAAARESSWSPPLRSALGVAGGLGFLIKPHFILAWVAVEIAAGRYRSRRVEMISASVAATGYVALVLVVVPEYREVADHVRRVYRGLDSTPAVLLRLREVQLWMAAAALWAAIKWPDEDRLSHVLFAAATGFLIAGLAQLKGWGYHLLPARAFTAIFLAAAAATLIELVPAAATVLRGGRRGLGLVFGAALVLASARYVAEARRPVTPDLVTPLVSILQSSGGPLAVLSMRAIIYPAFPAVNYSSAEWSLRHNGLWFLPGFYGDQDRMRGGPLEPHALTAMSPLERRFFDDIVSDLCARPPQVLLFEEPLPAAPAGRRALDLRAYYSQDPGAARLFGAYETRQSLGAFTVLERVRTGSCD
jgi:hypothetical protein